MLLLLASRAFPVCAVIVFLANLSHLATGQHSKAIKGQLNAALKSIGKRCLVSEKGRPLLEAINLNSFSLAPLIVDSSAFDVNISQVSIKNLNKFVVTEIDKLTSDENTPGKS